MIKPQKIIPILARVLLKNTNLVMVPMVNVNLEWSKSQLVSKFLDDLQVRHCIDFKFIINCLHTKDKIFWNTVYLNLSPYGQSRQTQMIFDIFVFCVSGALCILIWHCILSWSWSSTKLASYKISRIFQGSNNHISKVSLLL